MDIKKSFKSAVDIALLKKDAMITVAGDKDALRPALLILGLVAFATAVGYVIFPSTYGGGYIVYRPDIAWLIGKAVWTFALNLASLYLIGYLAVQLFKSKLDMDGFVKVMGHGMIVSLIALIPNLGFVGAMWGLVILWKALNEIGKLDVVEVIILLVITVIVVGALGFTGIVF